MRLLLQMKQRTGSSPMPFGLLWCCYTNVNDWAFSETPSHQCLSACCGVVTTDVSNALLSGVTSHQCLSACCGVVTPHGGRYCQARRVPVTNAFRPVVVLLRTCVSGGSSPENLSPMPFGLLWCCYAWRCKGTFAVSSSSPMPFGLLWCCYLERELNAANERIKSPMPFGLLWCCYNQELFEIAESFAVTNAFRPVVVLLQDDSSTFAPYRRLPVTNAFRPVVVLLLEHASDGPSFNFEVTNAFRPVVVLLHQPTGQGPSRGADVTNAFRPVVVLLQEPWVQGASGQGCVTNAFRPVVVLLQARSRRSTAPYQSSPMPFGLLWCCYTRTARQANR